MTTKDLVATFIKLSDDSKKRVIQELRNEGFSGEDIAGLCWLAELSKDQTQELMFAYLAPDYDNPDISEL